MSIKTQYESLDKSKLPKEVLFEVNEIKEDSQNFTNIPDFIEEDWNILWNDIILKKYKTAIKGKETKKTEPKKRLKTVTKNTKKKSDKKVTKKKSITKVADKEKVKHFSEEYKLIRRFYNLTKKEVEFRQVQLLYMAFSKVAVNQKVRKSTASNLYKKVAEKVTQLFNLMEENKLTKIKELVIKDKSLLKDLEVYVKSKQVDIAVRLMNRFINIQGTKATIKKAETLLKSINNAIDKNKVEKDNNLYDDIVKAKTVLEHYIESKHEKVDVTKHALNGVKSIKKKIKEIIYKPFYSIYLIDKNNDNFHQSFSYNKPYSFSKKEADSLYELEKPIHSEEFDKIVLEKLYFEKNELDIEKIIEEYGLESIEDVEDYKEEIIDFSIENINIDSDKVEVIRDDVILTENNETELWIENLKDDLAKHFDINKRSFDKYTSVYHEKSDDIYVSVRVSDHSQKFSNISDDYTLSIVIANNDATEDLYASKQIEKREIEPGDGNHAQIYFNSLDYSYNEVLNSSIKAISKQIDYAYKKENHELGGVSESSVDNLKSLGFKSSFETPKEAENIYRLNGEIGSLIQDIQPHQALIIIKGTKHTSKSQLAMQVADGFAGKNKKVAYIDYEQGGLECKDTIDSLNRNTKKQNRKNIFVKGFIENPMDELHKLSKFVDVIIADSVTDLGITADELNILRKTHPKTIWCFISQVKENGSMYGGNKMAHNPTVIIECHPANNFKERYATLEKNRGNDLSICYDIYKKKCFKLNDKGGRIY